jgi:hypothetical protein
MLTGVGQSEESKFVEDCLNTLSRRYATTRFVKLHHTEAEMDAAVVPAVLAYKGGDLFANIMRIVDEIPPGRNLSTESLELVLRRFVRSFAVSCIRQDHMANVDICRANVLYKD